MSKAVYGFIGDPPVYALLIRIDELVERVRALEDSVRTANADARALRAFSQPAPMERTVLTL